ncbi:ABC transporter ATP-binding protein [Azospirillum picis]|uniref:Spermidine/putrescine transport system ATP-binding protein n=1 Tax=Azospirillum picis TaxID=488438 RepID=A0ABU0MP97_9PROT|nr:ABC transporter ATP-binding protein [Azospirillum picis]MBP2301787.1 putative spermidine/putrescine transport system ATP-binding protein [Azospirillum picis]MDQ0535038.1 putative spermidine/putrescine transport system ATP-binding protein [Azospirillum picis]
MSPLPGTAPPACKLQIDGLTKSYGSVVALQPTRLEVPAGEFLTLLGPSGSGKTTLLQMICGLVEPSGGRILIDGRDETRTPVHKRDIGLVFQHYALFPHLTVSENIGFPLRMRGVAAADLDRRVRDALDMVHLGHLGDRFPKELSGGQQQRVALARCFVYQPSVILMDEPLGALDKKLRERMQYEIKRLHRETGATIIYVTHDQEEALAMSDRICLMNHARIEQIGTPHDIYARPKTAFAADFIGVSNIFRGSIQRDDGGAPILVTGGGRFRLSAAALADGAGQGEASLIVRPEQLDLDGDGDNEVSGRVVDTVYAGSETRVLVALGDQSTVTVRLRRGMAPPPLGDEVAVRWRSEAGVLVS